MKISDATTKTWMKIAADPSTQESADALADLKITDYAGYCSLLCSIFHIDVMRSQDDQGPFTYFCSRWPFSERVLELPVQLSEDPTVLALQAAERLQLADYYDLTLSIPSSHTDI